MDEQRDDLEARVRELTEKIEGLLLREHTLVNEYNRLNDAHRTFVADHDAFLIKLAQWMTDHEGRHREINDHLYPAFFKLFPEQQKFWNETERVLQRKKAESATPPEGAGGQPHDKWCLCTACREEVAGAAKRDGERILAETGHQKWCTCAVCWDRRNAEERRRLLDSSERLGFDPDEPPPPRDTAAREQNPFSASSGHTVAPNADVPSYYRPKGHEPDCTCLNCIRARGRGRR
jgi:hypothetical protein